jgi:3-hydroxy-D-aspartate aldolase
MTRPPARIGDPFNVVDTPALIIDLDAFEFNLRRMPESLVGKSVRVRPHAKTHKSPIIALKQIELGAVGVCCQKVSEAEALVYGGVKDVLVSNEIIGTQKLERLAALAKIARIGVCVDDGQNIRDLAAVATRINVKLDVYVEINVGTFRCGVTPGETAVVLAKEIAASKHLRFAGLQAYHGAAQHQRTHDARRASIHAACEHATATRQALQGAGLDCPIVTGAGTGTYLFEAASKVYNEIQPGSYIFMDADYGRNQSQDGAAVSEFRQSLFVWATVMSHPTNDRAVVDAGLKALSVDSGMPLVADFRGVEYARASDEHGVLLIKDAETKIALGEKIRLTPGHCDPTVNLHDWYVGVRNGVVEQLWPISARGAMF